MSTEEGRERWRSEDALLASVEAHKASFRLPFVGMKAELLRALLLDVSCLAVIVGEYEGGIADGEVLEECEIRLRKVALGLNELRGIELLRIE